MSKTPSTLKNGDGIVFLSDREKGIDLAVKALFPNAAHAFCVYHNQKNVKAKHYTTLDGLFFKAANAESDVEFYAIIDRMKALHRKAGLYVENLEEERWARAFFPARRYGHVTSNISESMNWWLEEARHLDPVGLFSAYIRKLNWLFEWHRSEFSSMGVDDLPDKVAGLFKKSIEDSWNLLVIPHSRTVFEVQSKTRPLLFRSVDLEKRTCSCTFF